MRFNKTFGSEIGDCFEFEISFSKAISKAIFEIDDEKQKFLLYNKLSSWIRYHQAR